MFCTSSCVLVGLRAKAQESVITSFLFLFPFLVRRKNPTKTPITRTYIESPPRTFKQRLPERERTCLPAFTHSRRTSRLCRRKAANDVPLRTRRRPPAGSPPLQLRQHLWRGSPPSPSRRLLPARLDFPDRQKPLGPLRERQQGATATIMANKRTMDRPKGEMYVSLKVVLGMEGQEGEKTYRDIRVGHLRSSVNDTILRAVIFAATATLVPNFTQCGPVTK